LTGTFSLVPQIVHLVEVPVIAAGGIADARGIVAALALGAEGVQIGTAFLTCHGSGATPHHKQALLRGKASGTGLTKGFTGRLARGIRNQLMEELNRAQAEILPYPLQRALIRNLSVPAEKAGRTEFVPMWAGQSASLAHPEDATVFLRHLVSEVSTIAPALLDWRKRGCSP
jgi:nitronate monooxygenase